MMNHILSIHGYELQKQIGKGGFGSCFLVYSTKYSAQFVCKIMNPKTLSARDDKNSFEREVAALVHLDHPNIIRIYDTFEEDGMFFIILEYCSGGNLKETIDYYHGVKGQQLHEYTKQILEALKFVHDHGYAHNDIKPANIFITDHDKLKLADFGLTEPCDANTSKFCGSFCYMSPEAIRGIPHDQKKSDIWSLGVTLYQLASGNLPYESTTLSELESEIKCGYEPIPFISNTMANIIQMCLKADPNKRASVNQLLNKIRLSPEFDHRFDNFHLSVKRMSNPIFGPKNRIIRPKIRTTPGSTQDSFCINV